MSDQDPMDCAKCGQPHGRCKGHNRRGKPCQKHPKADQLVCHDHGGESPQALAAADRRRVEREARADVELFGARRDIHPGEALLELVQWTAGECDYWRERVRQLNEDDLTWGVTKVKDGGDDRGTTSEAKPNIAYAMLTDASRRLESHCAAALRAGVEAAIVKIARSQGEQVGGAMRRFASRMLDRASAALADHPDAVAILQAIWADAVAEIAPEELRAIGRPDDHGEQEAS